MSDQDASDKTFDASPRKLEKAREKGEIVRSLDLHAACSYLGFWVAMALFGAPLLLAIGGSLQGLVVSALAHPQHSAPAGAYHSLAYAAIVCVVALPVYLNLTGLFAMRGVVFTPKKIRPKLDRISPIKNAKNKYGRSGLFEFFKSLVKLLVFGTSLVLLLLHNQELILGVINAAGTLGIIAMLDLCVDFIGVAAIVAILLASLDVTWQKAEHLRKNRMSHKELRDEAKEAEGDPHLKQFRRRKAQEIAMQQMLSQVPSAEVILVNPTHYAVALTWSRTPGSAPICVAKGVDEIASRIRASAQENNVPIRSDPPVARALFATCEIGDEINQDFYAPVAAAIQFADKLRSELKSR